MSASSMNIALPRVWGIKRFPLQRRVRWRDSLPILRPRSVPFAASDSSADCCAVTIALRPEPSPVSTTKRIFVRVPPRIMQPLALGVVQGRHVSERRRPGLTNRPRPCPRRRFGTPSTFWPSAGGPARGFPTIAFIRGRLLPRHQGRSERKDGLCIKCGYDLTEDVSGTFLECGREAGVLLCPDGRTRTTW